MRKRLTAALLVCSLYCEAQTDYPQNYLINPLKIPISLAGNFGECRPGHFHSGLDIKTNGEENYPVHAAADGYISRIKMEPGGFGHAIYITHPNGYTSLYAHLNNFFPALQQVVHERQYAAKSWEQDINFPPGTFPVKQGQFIAWSGNTGGSTAPHLHFEIRKTATEHPLNPQLFGLPITDDVAPVPSSVAVYDAGNSIYRQQPLLAPLRKRGNKYISDSSLYVQAEQIRVGIAVNDYMNGSQNTLSVYKAEWYWNDTLAGSFTADDIGYDETRYLNACADYALHYDKGTWYNSLFVLKGNKLKRLYEIEQDKLTVRDSNMLRIVFRDASGNQSETETVIRKQPVSSGIPGTCAVLWEAGLPHIYEAPGCRASFGANALYDDICFVYTSKKTFDAFSAVHQLHEARVPLHSAADITLQPDRAIPLKLLSKVCMRYTDGKDTSGKAVVNTDQRYTSHFRNLGMFWLDCDTTQPEIKVSGRFKKEIRVRISDDKTSIQRMRGYLKSSGQWLCFEQHGKEWFYRFDEYFPAKGAATVILEATDENGNKAVREITVKR
ncbi:MAG: M23 family metallopeptidase [Chitinophagaceae bacterium]